YFPFRLQDIYYDVCRSESSQGHSLSEIAVIPRDEIDPILRLLTSTGRRCSKIGLLLSSGIKMDSRFDFGWERPRTWRMNFRRERAVAVALAILLCLIAATLVERRWDKQRDLLNAIIAQRIVAATEARHLKDELTIAQRKIELLESLKKGDRNL